tara:strand:- start:66 stop:1337 length:1272 start_codon:yes stop_codon:yes gene_type:complete
MQHILRKKHGNRTPCDLKLTNIEQPKNEIVSKKLTNENLEKHEKSEKKHIFKRPKKNVFGNDKKTENCDFPITKGEKDQKLDQTIKVRDEKSPSNTFAHFFGEKMCSNWKSINKLKPMIDNCSMERKYSCEICDYNTHRQWCLKRHIQSKKHLKKAGLMCRVCEKIYETKSGCWKHFQKCSEQKKKKKEENFSNNTSENKNAENTVIQNMGKAIVAILENQQQQQKVQQDLIGTMNKMIPKIGNNTINNNTINNNQKISIKVFLNDHCKDAINLKDFVQNIELTYDNLRHAVRNGGAEAISDVLVQKLTDMKPTERPIHCSDARRSHFYVKDKGRWARDNNTKKIDGAITSLAKKQLDNLYKWTQENPNWIHNAELSDQWNEMTQQIAWTAEEARKYRAQIKRSLMKPTNLKEAMETTAEKII